MLEINLPSTYNYIGIFLTLACNLKCSYCINHLSGQAKKSKILSAEQWRLFFERLNITSDLRLTIQGGEPSVHPQFYQILNYIPQNINIDLLTNIRFDPKEFVKKVSANRFKPHTHYPSIRVSYHPETMSLTETIEKVKVMQEHGFSIGVYCVDHPSYAEEIIKARDEADKHNVFFKTKEFLGVIGNKIYGNYKYTDSVFNQKFSQCLCKTSELLVAPNGLVYRCHHDLYNEFNSIGDALDDNFTIEDKFRSCDKLGNCNPCDVKIKNNRFQIWGHTSVEIKNIQSI